MSGHSKWSQIKRSKGIKDVKKGAELNKVSKEISLAVRLGGGGDLEFNPSLRVAVEKAKAANMTNDKIKYAIDKGLGNTGEGNKLVEKTYEIVTQNNIAVLVDCETDNPNRVIGEIKNILFRHNAKFVPEGSIAWQFKEKILISFRVKSGNTDAILLELFDLGVEDVENNPDKSLTLVTTKQSAAKINKYLYETMSDQVEVDSLEILKIPENYIDSTEEKYAELMEVIEKLEENPDVVNTWNNARLI